MTLEEQLAYIEKARLNILQWAGEQAIPLYRVEYVVPFVDIDFDLLTWFFYETDEQLNRSQEMVWPNRLVSHFPGVLKGLGYPAAWLSEVTFTFDSHENVVRNYQGSYFYRLR